MKDRTWIKDALALRGYSQRDLAKWWGINETSVSRFIAGTEDEDPRVSKAAKLAEMLGMGLDELAKRLGLMSAGKAPPPAIKPAMSSDAPRVGTIQMAPSPDGPELRVLIHLDLPARVAAEMVGLLDDALQRRAAAPPRSLPQPGEG
jgi:DNA-binding XRE family transcriptional regulator